MTRYMQEKSNLMKTYDRNLMGLIDSLPIFRVADELIKFWKELTGCTAEFSYSCRIVVLRVYMGHTMRNGEYPTRGWELALLAEYADELMAPYVEFDQFTQELDAYSTDMKWGAFPGKLQIHAWHGGNCTYKQVGSKTIEQPIYEMECL